MAYTAASGPPEMDATHAWAPAGGATAPPTINNRSTDPPTYPWIKLYRVNGWRSRPEREDNRAPRTFGQGEITYPSRRLGKTLVYEAEVRAKTRESLHDTLTALLRGYDSVADTEDGSEGTMTVTPYTMPGGVVWTFTARCLDVQPDPTWSWSRDKAYLWWPVAITLRMSDPRFYTGGTGYL